MQAICLTGGSGFVGSAVLSALLERDYRVHALVHSRPLQVADERITSFSGGLFDEAVLDEAIAGCHAVIHLVGIIAQNPSAGVIFDRIHREGTRHIVDAARRRGVKRFIYISAAGARQDAPSQYHRTKYAAEQIVRAGGLDATIFQPSLIHGPGGNLLKMEIAWAHKKAAPYIAMPYFGKGLFGLAGSGMLQPIYVKDVARAFVEALSVDGSIDRTFELGGSERVSWPQFHQEIAQKVMGHGRLTLPIPAWLALTMTRLLPQRLLPFNRDQVVMSQEDNTVEMDEFVEIFGWTPAGLAATLAQYL